MSHFSIRLWGVPATLIAVLLLVAALPVLAAPRGLAAAGPSVASGTWKSTSRLTTARTYHTAILLQDGRCWSPAAMALPAST